MRLFQTPSEFGEHSHLRNARRRTGQSSAPGDGAGCLFRKPQPSARLREDGRQGQRAVDFSRRRLQCCRHARRRAPTSWTSGRTERRAQARMPTLSPPASPVIRNSLLWSIARPGIAANHVGRVGRALQNRRGDNAPIFAAHTGGDARNVRLFRGVGFHHGLLKRRRLRDRCGGSDLSEIPAAALSGGKARGACLAFAAHDGRAAPRFGFQSPRRDRDSIRHRRLRGLRADRPVGSGRSLWPAQSPRRAPRRV